MSGVETMSYLNLQPAVIRLAPVVAEMDRSIGRLIERCIAEAVAFDVARTSFAAAMRTYADQRTADDLKAWARAQGFEAADDVDYARHALVAYAQARMARALRMIMS